MINHLDKRSSCPFFSVLVVIVTAMSTACSHSKSQAAEPRVAEIGRPHYVQRPGYDTVVVFVHGIFGDATTTWTNSKTHAYFPELVAKDKDIGNVDVFVHAYSSPFFSESYTIDELVEQMRTVFKEHEIFTKHQKVVFVCHSMGGLVTRAFLKRYEELRSRVPLIYLYGTPTSGSDLARMQVLSRNGQLKGMLPLAANEFLSSVQNDWRAIHARPYTRCAYEVLPIVPKVWVVPKESAVALCDDSTDPIEEDHVGIVKPTDSGDQIFAVLKQAIEDTSAANSISRPSPVQTDADSNATRRTIPIDCGQSLDTQIDFELPRRLDPAERVIKAEADIERQEFVKAVKLDENSKVTLYPAGRAVARIHLNAEGMSPAISGVCGSMGSVVVSVRFEIAR